MFNAFEFFFYPPSFLACHVSVIAFLRGTMHLNTFGEKTVHE